MKYIKLQFAKLFVFIWVIVLSNWYDEPVSIIDIFIILMLLDLSIANLTRDES